MSASRPGRPAQVLKATSAQVRQVRIPLLALQGSAGLEHGPADAAGDALEHARLEGFSAGLAAARLQPVPEALAARNELRAELASIDELMRDFEQRLTMFVVALSLQLSRLVLRSGVRIKPDQVAPAVREAVSRLPGLAAQTRMHMHPADAALMREVTGTEGHPSLTWQIVEDATLARGQCRLVDAGPGEEHPNGASWRQAIEELGRSVDWIDASSAEGGDVVG
jgi:flagellar assembly protein FliH